MILLALCGPKGSGKSTLARLLALQHRYKRHPFARPIKDMMTALLACQGADKLLVHRMLYDDLKEAPTPLLCGATPRLAMQTLGTEWRNTIHPELWIRILERQITDGAPTRRIVVEDLRFPLEAAMIREHSGRIIRINRPGFGPSAHASESEFVGIVPDATIINDAEPEQMLEKLTQQLGIAL